MKPAKFLLMGFIGGALLTCQAGVPISVNFADGGAVLTGRCPYSFNSVVAADVNGDSKVDLISASCSDNTLTVFTNDGAGGFSSGSPTPVETNPRTVATADVNGDGKVDLICANSGDNTLTVLTNNGCGGFVISSSPVVGANPISVVAADVNHDGHMDLICANSGDNTLMVLTNDGRGGFKVSGTQLLEVSPSAMIAADVNGDGMPDLIVACHNWENYFDDKLMVLTNNGAGGFTLAWSPEVGFGPIAVAAADVNGDGKIDLISANYDDNTLTVLTNDGSGGFSLSCSPAVGSTPISVLAADVNGDGKPDLVCANYSSGEGSCLTVLLNDGQGTFMPGSTLHVAMAPVDIAAADINGDGKPDLISANQGEQSLLSLLINTTSFPVTPPTLAITLSGSNVILTWPADTTTFTLQQNRTCDSSDWVDVTNSPALIGELNQVTLPSSGGQCFYRLKFP